MAIPHIREQLVYAARRFPVKDTIGGLGKALGQLRNHLSDEGVLREVRTRRYRIKPSEQEHLARFRSRQSMFNRRVAMHISRIAEIEESLK